MKLNIFKINKYYKQKIGVLILASQAVSLLTPILAFAAPQTVSGTDIQNSLETVGTKANRLKTVGSSGVDESTGAFTYSYPFSLPKGLLGLEPSISLSYNSQASENSIVGYGWTLAMPYIERSAKKGVDKIYTNTDFVSSLGGELILKPGTTNVYIQKIDDGSFQEYTLSNNIWTLKDRSGNTYTYGTTLDSRLSDETGTKIAKYFLTEVRDVMGNKIKYFYEKKNNFVYPKEIAYTIKKDGTYSNKIIFERESRLDEEVSYRTQFRVVMNDRIKSILVQNNGIDVAKLDLTYTTGQNGTRSLLSSIKESRLGTDSQWSTIPETKFEYEKTNIVTRNTSSTIQGNQGYQDITGDAKPDYFSTTNGAQVYAPWKVIDFNGDYFPDMYYHLEKQTYCNGYCGLYWQPAEGVLKMGIGEGQFISLPISKILDINLPVTSNYDWYYRGSDNGTLITDLNMDGLSDLISNGSLYINIGGKFSSITNTIGSYENLVDVNGDGLLDKIYNKEIYLNNGISWNTATGTKYKVPFDKEISLNGKNFDAGVRYIDLNADGLVDIVRSYNARYFYGWGGGNGSSFANDVYLNNGSEWVKSTEIKIDGYLVDSYLYYNPTGPEELTVTYKDIQEINSDGTTLITKQDVLKSVVSPLGSKSEVTYKGSVSQNNPKLPINIQTVSEIKTTEVNKNLVDTTKYSYENGKMYFDQNNVYDRRFAGFQKVTTESGTKKTIKYFHQGDGDDVTTNERGDSFHNIGRVYKEEVYGGATKYAETYREYGVYDYNGQVYKYPKQEVSVEFDKYGGKISKATAYTYDLASRLPIKTENFGEVNFDPTTGKFTDLGDDYILTKNLNTNKRPQKVLSEEIFDINGKFLDKKVYFYDELPFGYVEKGLLSEERNYSSANNFVKTTYTYNDKGLVDTKVENNGATTKYVYDENYNPISVTNALNQTVTNTYDKVSGAVVSSTDANGKVTSNIYDGFGNVKSVTTTSPKDALQKLGATKNISYSGNGMQEIENIYNDGQIYKTSIKTYDSFGRLIKSQSTNTDNSLQTIDVTYNNFGQITNVTYPYDNYGVLTAYNSALDTKYTYDELGRTVTVSQGDLKNFTEYYVNKKVTSDNTPDQHKKEYTYNSLGKLKSVKEFTSASGFNETKYEWSLLGNLLKITDAANNVRNFSYDSEGRLTKQEDLHAQDDNTFATYKYTYDANGNLTSKTDPKDQVATYEYDILNRPKTESFGVVTNYTYDTCVNGKGALCEISNKNYSQKLEYNKTGQIAVEKKNIDDQTFIHMYEYNDLGQNTKIVLPDSTYISYSYDKNGKQASASVTRMLNNTASTTQIVSGAKYNIDGTLKSIIQGNNVKTCYEYSATNGGNVFPRLSGIKIGKNNSCESELLFSQNLSYNLFGSIVENKEKWGTESEIINKYSYDVLQRLVKSERTENNLSTVNNMTYNSLGNILSSDSTQYSYDGSDYKNPHAPTLIGNTRMTYDLNGNITNDGKNDFEWNVKNQLKKVVNDKSTSEYVYDVSGERIKETTTIRKSATNNDSEKLAFSDQIIFSDEVTEQVAAPAEKVYISKEAFNEIDTKLNSLKATITPDFVRNIILPVYTSSYITNVCKDIKIAQKDACERENTLKKEKTLITNC
jgi:YD repeat-containing protein